MRRLAMLLKHQHQRTKESNMPHLTDGLTNSQILAVSKQRLTTIQKQVRYIMEMELTRKPCPNCGTPHNLPDAAGVTIDEFNFASKGSDRVGPCTKCKRTLIFTLPFVGDWHWRLDTSEAS
jgi:hypothetical protein